ncbi:phage tail protein [Rhodobacter sp. TJ_12]|uniref:phage tail protein n=1 Tax=Rhodobacter sp. TJ_12 TaxID=2029399 RepID=UPI001CC0BD33|nr:tail fiber protein [Rhodobacter sp. TJ_12]MBZ4024115.1 phage tail protein [Rhodobacter sp. TJ_12]
MSEPFLAEIRMVGFDFAPRGWSFLDGQILPINQNQALYSLLGTTYGGDGRTTFALPDLRGRTPIHRSDAQELGQKGGAETVTLTVAEMPDHMHYAKAQAATGNERSPENNYLSAPSIPGLAFYADHQSGTSVALRSGTVTNAGGSQAHDNMQPYLTVSFCIALQGLFPSRN